jgi:hypothetical protein
VQPGYVEIQGGVFTWGKSRAKVENASVHGPGKDAAAKPEDKGKANGKGGKDNADEKSGKQKAKRDRKARGKKGKADTEAKGASEDEEVTKEVADDDKPALEVCITSSQHSFCHNRLSQPPFNHNTFLSSADHRLLSCNLV